MQIDKVVRYYLLNHRKDNRSRIFCCFIYLIEFKIFWSALLSNFLSKTFCRCHSLLNKMLTSTFWWKFNKVFMIICAYWPLKPHFLPFFYLIKFKIHLVTLNLRFLTAYFFYVLLLFKQYTNQQNLTKLRYYL